MNTARRTGIPRSAIASLGFGLLGALSGCFNPTPPANVLCAPDGWCPSGQTCDTGRWMCVPNGYIPDAGGWPWFDSGWPWPPPPDSSYPWPDAGAQEGIEAALNAPWGPVYIDIKQVLVTYVKPAVEAEPEGFFVQSDPYGPAMFVAVSPDFLGVRLSVGDRVSFRVDQMGGLYDNSIAQSIGELVVHSRGNDVSGLVQDVNWAYDLTSNTSTYVSELVTAELYIDSGFYDDGYGSLLAPVGTNVIFGDGTLVVRLSSALQEQVGLEPGCSFQLYGVPFWRYWTESIFPVHDVSELQGVSCPGPRIENIEADSDTSVRIELSRTIDAATVQADGSQFPISGLTVTAAEVDGRVLTLTTSPQSAGELYTIELADSVLDIFGRSIDPRSVSFVGAAPRARVVINEVKANITPSCDLLELRVTRGGTMDGIQITEQGSPVHTFRDLQVVTDDLIVIHFDSSRTLCNPGRSISETQSVNERPRVVFGANFDTAYDIHYIPAAGLGVAPHTIAVYDHRGRIADVVLVTGGSSLPGAESEQEAALAAQAGEWRAESGNVPPGGFTGVAFRDHAAAGLDVDPVSVVSGWSALDGNSSVQRSSNADSNHKGDWTTAPHSFGVLNPGQSPL